MSSGNGLVRASRSRVPDTRAKTDAERSSRPNSSRLAGLRRIL